MLLILIVLELNTFHKKLKKFIGNKNIQVNIFRMQVYDSVMCGYFSIEFIDLVFKDKSLIGFTNLFSPNDLKKNSDIILNYFRNG